MRKKQLPTRVDPLVISKLKVFAKEDNRPLSNYVETILKNHINEKETRKSSK